MADTIEPEGHLGAQIATFAETAARIRELNELLIERAVAEGYKALDAYERALATLVEQTEQVGATQLGWLAAVAQMHADFLRDVCTVYTVTVRALLD